MQVHLSFDISICCSRQAYSGVVSIPTLDNGMSLLDKFAHFFVTGLPTSMSTQKRRLAFDSHNSAASHKFPCICEAQAKATATAK